MSQRKRKSEAQRRMRYNGGEEIEDKENTRRESLKKTGSFYETYIFLY